MRLRLYFMRQKRIIMEIGTKIKKVREYQNLTQEYVAHELGITQESYSKIESNKANLTVSRLAKIAELFKMEVSDLMNLPETFVFHESFQNQQHSNNYFGTQQALLERIIEQQKQALDNQKSEIEFLRSLLKDKDPTNKPSV